jgi:hypothetical protein
LRWVVSGGGQRGVEGDAFTDERNGPGELGEHLLRREDARRTGRLRHRG